MTRHDRMAVVVLFAVVAGGILYLRQLSPEQRENGSAVEFTQDFTGPESDPFPDSEQILATASEGGWIIVDFISGGEPLWETQQCVRSRRQAAAVSCYAFATSEDYAAAKPSMAGSFEETCYEARWRRNKFGNESGRINKFKTSGCPITESTVSEPEPAPSPVAARSPDSLRVTISMNHEITAAGLFIVGTTNLPDGTALSTSVTAPESGFMAQNSTYVRNGRFRSGPFSHGGRPFPPGQYELSVTVPFYNAQSASVRRVLGDRLQYMIGPLTEWMSVRSLGKVARIEKTIRIR